MVKDYHHRYFTSSPGFTDTLEHGSVTDLVHGLVELGPKPPICALATDHIVLVEPTSGVVIFYSETCTDTW